MSLTLIIEAVDSVNWGTLMISSQKEEILRIFDLISQQKANNLQAVLSSVNVISQEKVVGLRRVATILKKSQQVRILPMDIT